jgi:HK97 gp10 family phage protein
MDVDTSELVALAAELEAAAGKVAKVSSEKLSGFAREVRDDAKANAPVDEGTLRDSIELYGGEDWRIIRATARHSVFVEYGTSKMAPQPFMWPAARRVESRLFREYERLGDPFD